MSLHVLNGRPARPPFGISNFQSQIPAPPPCPGDLAVVTCLFNPAGYRRPLANFKRFAKHMEACGVEWCPAELSFGAKWQIAAKYNPLRLRTADVLWHKESLLNILVAALPARITKVAWVDADVLWKTPDWPRLADAALQTHNVIQLFRECVRLDRHGAEDSRQHSAAWAHVHGQPDKGNLGKWHPGFAWAARRELWQHGGLFDLHLTGGGDSLMAEAFMGLRRPDVARAYGPAIHAAWQRWAAQAGAWCDGRLGYIDAPLTHLWHGDRADRRYWERLQYLQGLDLERDVERGANGLLRWKRSRDECPMRAQTEDYFATRKEDG